MPLKKFVLACLMAFAPLASYCLGTGASAPATVSGEVLEVKDVAVYTYLRLKTSQGETWAAVVTAAGTVRTDKDFGAGYSDKVLIEDATLKP